MATRVVLNPYDLAQSSPAACAALLLGARVVTLLPTPVEGSGEESLLRAAQDTPEYVGLLQRWEWTGALWRAGVLAGEDGGNGPSRYLAAACAIVADDPAMEPLREYVDADLFSDSKAYLAALARDWETGGTNPAVTLPVVAAVEMYAASVGATVFRAPSDSLTGRFERRAQKATARWWVPVLRRNDAGLLMEVRERGADVLAELDHSVGIANKEYEEIRLLRDELMLELESIMCDVTRGRTGEIARASVRVSSVPACGSLIAAAAAAGGSSSDYAQLQSGRGSGIALGSKGFLAATVSRIGG